jgi:carboxyl-terminal processing protease
MSHSDEPRVQRTPARDRLPVLSWLLVVLVFAYFGSGLVLRGPREERLRLASMKDALEAIPEIYVDKVDEDKLYHAAMQGMVASLGDKYSAYLTPAQRERLSEDTEGEYGGIGVVFFAGNGRDIVENVIPGGPAARAGLQAGDVITQVGGESIANLGADEVGALIRGPVGTDVELTLLRPPSGESFTRKLTREKIAIPNVEHKMLDGGVGFLRVATFDQNCAKEVKEALLALMDAGMKGLILDLRRNSGGLVKEATEMCDMFVDKGLLLSQKGRDGKEESRTMATPGTVLPPDVPVVVLVDHGTASAAEIVAGTLQAHGRASVVGTGTVGKGCVNTVVRLPDHSGLLLTVTRYELEGGKVIANVGITPDVRAGEMPKPPEGMNPEQAWTWYVQQRDKADQAQLQAAEDLITQKLAGH